MDMDLKRVLLNKLNDIAPEYGLVELLYPSFMRCYGYRSQPLSAADAVEGIRALLDVASGVRIEVEVEGARNGGEWFGGGRVWEANMSREVTRRSSGKDGAGNPPRAAAGDGTSSEKKASEEEQTGQDEIETKKEAKWWVKNFWKGYDALNE
jgi:cell division control protein 45